jgi:hypothetical protein
VLHGWSDGQRLPAAAPQRGRDLPCRTHMAPNLTSDDVIPQVQLKPALLALTADALPEALHGFQLQDWLGLEDWLELQRRTRRNATEQCATCVHTS